MDFLLPSELLEFDAVLRDLLSAHVASGLRRAPGKRTEAVWDELNELGALKAGLPEEVDGLGFGLMGTAFLLEHAGEALLPLPLLERLGFGWTAALLLGGGAPEVEALLRGAAKLTGAFEGCYAVAEGDDRNILRLTQLESGAPAVSGTFEIVPAVDNAADGLLALSAVGPESYQLIQITAYDSTPADTLDLTRSYSTVSFKDAGAIKLGEPFGARALFTCLDALAVLISAELAGLGRGALNMTVDYVKTREQFGRPIGSFQAIQHKLADMLLHVEQVVSLTRFAAWSHSSDPDQFPSAARAAKALASELIPEVIEQGLQAHGGIGFTYEYDLHLFLRRARVLAATLAPTAFLYESVGRDYR